MKKLEIARVDSTTQETEIITLTSEYGLFEEKWATLQTVMNQAEPEQWIYIDYGQSGLLMLKKEILYIVESEVNV